MGQEIRQTQLGEFAGPEGAVMMDAGPAIVASTLSPQLGTDTIDLSRGRFDMRRLSVIKDEDIPVLLYAKIRSKKSDAWKTLYGELLNLKVAVGGRGRRDIIRMEAVSKGGQAAVEAEIEKPGWLARTFTDRNWRQRQLEEKI